VILLKNEIQLQKIRSLRFVKIIGFAGCCQGEKKEHPIENNAGVVAARVNRKERAAWLT
jgi:hypothetical protein